MVAELFFPKDIKEEVNKLHNNRYINYEAIDLANKPIYFYGVLAFFSFISLWEMNVPDYRIPLLLMLVYIFGPFYSVRLICQKFFTPYLFGEQVSLQFKYARTNIKYGDFWVLVDAQNNVEYRTPNFQALNAYRNKFHAGDSITCFLNPKNQGKCMPALTGVMQKACLSKSIIKGVSIHD